jgi:prepilin-type N-terminal cleavage/methylation domain-containing protein
MNRSTAQPRPAFTLIELVVAIVIMAVMVGLIVPRLLSTTERKLRAEAQSVADLVTVAARRAALSTQRVALRFDSQTGLSVLVLRAKDPGSFATGNLEWAPDPLAPTVSLDDLSIGSAAADGKPLPASSWRVEFAPSVRTPDLAIGLREAGGRAWTVLLASGSLQARAAEGSPLQVAAQPTVVDLDAGAKGDQPW